MLDKKTIKILKLYRTYDSINDRCSGRRDSHNYCDRGIKNRFKDLEDFAAYVLNLPNAFEPGFTLDRINNNKGYQKGNLRWVPAIIQSLNTRAVQIKKTLPFVSTTQGSKLNPFRVKIRDRKNRNRVLVTKGFSTELQAFKYALKMYKKLYPKKIYEMIKSECNRIKRQKGK